MIFVPNSLPDSLPALQTNHIQCQICKRSYHPDDTVIGICGYCWQERLKAIDLLAVDEHANDAGHKCFECGLNVIDVGWLMWDRLANQFKYVCFECGNHQHQADNQFRGTEFSYREKLQ